MTPHDQKPLEFPLGRRQLLQGTLAAAAASAVPGLALGAGGADDAPLRGRIKQSIVYWCFNGNGEKWDMDRTCQVARQLGCVSVELSEPKTWPVLRRHGLTCAIAGNGMPGAAFKRGFNNPVHRAELVAHTRQAIDDCAAAGYPSVIAFVGYKWRKPEDPSSGEISLEEGMDNCVAGLKEVAGDAERKGINICVEHLNTRDHSHPMKGHPGYQGDDLDRVAEMIRRVGSRRVKLLFDIYHVQIMHGDLIRRLEQTKDILGHVHTAGNPGRNELDENQEIQYPPLMRKLLELGYTGYVGQEFIPTRAPFEGLRQAVRLCDV
jgi:sugar phosphate isomerase/epimerase